MTFDILTYKGNILLVSPCSYYWPVRNFATLRVISDNVKPINMPYERQTGMAGSA